MTAEPGGQVTLEAKPGNFLDAALLGINPDRSFVVEVFETSQDAKGVIHVADSARW